MCLSPCFSEAMGGLRHFVSAPPSLGVHGYFGRGGGAMAAGNSATSGAVGGRGHRDGNRDESRTATAPLFRVFSSKTKVSLRLNTPTRDVAGRTNIFSLACLLSLFPERTVPS